MMLSNISNILEPVEARIAGLLEHLIPDQIDKITIEENVLMTILERLLDHQLEGDIIVSSEIEIDSHLKYI